MDGDVFAKRKQTHPVPCRDGEGSVITFNALELAALLDGLLFIKNDESKKNRLTKTQMSIQIQEQPTF